MSANSIIICTFFVFVLFLLTGEKDRWSKCGLSLLYAPTVWIVAAVIALLLFVVHRLRLLLKVLWKWVRTVSNDMGCGSAQGAVRDGLVDLFNGQNTIRRSHHRKFMSESVA